jgi:hypothetical protein
MNDLFRLLDRLASDPMVMPALALLVSVALSYLMSELLSR